MNAATFTKGTNMTEKSGMNVIEALRQEAAKDKTAKDVFHVMSLRERARNIVTLGGLEQRMKKEGFNYERGDYVTVLKFMAGLGFGKLEVDSRGRVQALKDIKVTLQSIGEAALGQHAELQAWRPRNKFRPLATPPVHKYVRPTAHYPVSLTVVVNGKSVNVSLPSDLNAKDIADLVSRLRSQEL